MDRNRTFHSVLLAAGVLLLAACASPPKGSLLETKFQRAAKNYEQFQYRGQTIYCQRTGTRSMPYACLTESQLRLQVENYHRSRSTSSGSSVPAGAGQGGIEG